MFKKGLFYLLCFVSLGVKAGDTLRYTLQACREMALNNSVSTQVQTESMLAAKYNRQAALAMMFPRVSANGGYMWNSRNAHLASNEHTFPFGTAAVGNDGTSSFQWSDQSVVAELGALVQGTPLQQPFMNVSNAAGQAISDTYGKLYDALTLNLQHIVVAQVGVVQPIYTGGRLTQMYRISKSVENLASIRSNAKHDDIIYNVDEAYWRVVSVAHKKALAEQYYRLLEKLEHDVTEAVQEGMATQSDLLMVMTKKGEAEVKRLQAENGLTLSRMALAQVCGLPLATVMELDDTGLSETQLPVDQMVAAAAVSGRSEMKMMEEVERIAKSSARLASAGLQPNILASANYIWTNPNVENGVRDDWSGSGFFNAGVVVNVPIAHADAILRYKAAKHAAKVATLKTEETRELLTLQTTQVNQKLMEAQQKIVWARMTEKNASEVLRMAEESYKAGMIPASDLMKAQTGWMAAAGDLIDAEVEAKTTETKLRKYLHTL